MDNFTLYMHRNKVNNKVYIGVTCQKAKDRWRKGKVYNKAFKADIEQYGWDNFEHIIIETGLSQQDALAKERELVKQYNSNNPAYGYNYKCGGDVMGMMGKHHSKEVKQLLHDKMAKVVFTEEHKKHISESKQGIKHHYAKPVYQYSINGDFIRKWDYMSEATKELNINKGNITEVCKGHRKSAGGYVWKYERS